jgi:integrase
MHDKEFSVNYFGSIIKCLKVFLNEATERGVNSNLAYKSRKFITTEEEVDNIYLSEKDLSEIAKLKDLDLSLERTRDLFLIGAYTGLRFSDLVQVKKEKIKGNILKLRQTKTGGEVVIPLKKEVLTILKKYDVLPVQANVKMNLNLKDIAKAAKIKEWQRVSTHTARRSFATNAYLAGVPVIGIMKITGHQTQKNFLRYIKITNQENATTLLSHPFFK